MKPTPSRSLVYCFDERCFVYFHNARYLVILGNLPERADSGSSGDIGEGVAAAPGYRVRRGRGGAHA